MPRPPPGTILPLKKRLWVRREWRDDDHPPPDDHSGGGGLRNGVSPPDERRVGRTERHGCHPDERHVGDGESDADPPEERPSTSHPSGNQLDNIFRPWCSSGPGGVRDASRIQDSKSGPLDSNISPEEEEEEEDLKFSRRHGEDGRMKGATSSIIASSIITPPSGGSYAPSASNCGVGEHRQASSLESMTFSSQEEDLKCAVPAPHCSKSGLNEGEEGLDAPVCQENVASPRTKRRHLSNPRVRVFKCPDCGRHFQRRDYLMTHRRVHTGERPYSCNTCGATFTQTCNLIYHRRTHTGEKPYRCTVCERKFSGSSHLRRHMRHHTGEKPYVCFNCPAAFVTWDSLSRHRVRLHSHVV